jgi:hypothetical protein
MVYYSVRKEEKEMKKTKCPKCKGKGCSHCGGTGYHKSKMNKGGVMGKKMNKGMKALKKAAPAVAKKMGYMGGGMAVDYETGMAPMQEDGMAMGYGGMVKKKKKMAYGGMAKKKMAYGGMAKKAKGFAHGGKACGASNPPARPIKKMGRGK